MQLNLDIHNELIIDNFAGGGGASTGIEMALQRRVDIAINHDPDAIAMHTANHPETTHYCESVWDVCPREVTQGRPVGLVWLSPDCKHFSKAKGGKPVSKNIRGLAWVALRWAGTVKPRVIMLENVEEFVTWGPLQPDGKPCKKRRGNTFKSFVRALNRQGYNVEYKELRACDYGSPTTRKRFFLIARRDGRPIIWPEPTHAAPDSTEVKKKQRSPWQTAADIIDWNIQAHSIFLTKEQGKQLGVRRPLAENTMARIARGIRRYVLDAAEPFIVTYYGPKKESDFRGGAINSPIKTQTTENRHAVIIPHVQRQFGCSVGHSVTDPTATVTAGGGGYTGAGIAPTKPTDTVTTQDHHALITSNMIKLRGTNTGTPTDHPIPTITAGGTHIGEVRAFLIKYYGTDQNPKLTDPMHTITTKHRMGLVTVAGEDYQIIDIGMRMLEPRELFRAQGFPDHYRIDITGANGKPLSKAAQVRMAGNSVCPQIAAALVSANVPELAAGKVQPKKAKTA